MRLISLQPNKNQLAWRCKDLAMLRMICHVEILAGNTGMLIFFEPGTGRTAFTEVPPNRYPFYNDEEKYIPVMQSDGAQLSGAIIVIVRLAHVVEEFAGNIQ